MKKRMLAMLMAIVMVLSLSAVAYADDWQDTDGDGLPGLWVPEKDQDKNDVGKTTVTVGSDPEEPENQVMIYQQTTNLGNRKSAYYLVYNIEDTEHKATLEYRYRVSEDTKAGFLMLPSFIDASGSYVLQIVVEDGKISYREHKGSWKKLDVDVTQEMGQWHTVKHVVDIDSKSSKLYLGDIEVALDTSAVSFSDLSGVKFGFENVALGTAYLDDVKITVGEVAEEEGGGDEVEETKIKFCNMNLALGNTLDFGFDVAKNQVTDWTGYTAKVTKYGVNEEGETWSYYKWYPLTDCETVTVRNSEGEEVECYRIKFDGISAKMMTDDITVQIYNGDTPVSDPYTTTVKKYAEQLAVLEPVKADAVKALLVYGREAQKLFNYKLDALAYAEETAAE